MSTKQNQTASADLTFLCLFKNAEDVQGTRIVPFVKFDLTSTSFLKPIYESWQTKGERSILLEDSRLQCFSSKSQRAKNKKGTHRPKVVIGFVECTERRFQRMFSLATVTQTHCTVQKGFMTSQPKPSEMESPEQSQRDDTGHCKFREFV